MLVQHTSTNVTDDDGGEVALYCMPACDVVTQLVHDTCSNLWLLI